MDIAIITLSVMAALILLVLFLWPLALRMFARKYYQQSYRPVPIEAAPERDYPAEYHLDTVPWITSPYPLGQSTSLQMIAASHGIEYPRANFDFLMAFTYGASSLPGVGFTPLGTDPEIGLEMAAPYLGLKRVYSVAQDPQVFLTALRSAIFKGFPVRVALDEGILYGKREFIAHSVVLVGYDPRGFTYYETVGLPPAPVEPGERPAGERGLYVTDAVLLEAVEKMSQRMNYPWRYALTTFEPAPLEEDLRPIWLLIGRAMVDENKYGPRMGARVIEDLAVKIEREGPKFDLSQVRAGVELAAQVRQDNAQFLRSNFPLHADLLEAAGWLEQAAHFYRLVDAELQHGIQNSIEARRVAAWLFDAAAAERKTGEIFIKRGNVPV